MVEKKVGGIPFGVIAHQWRARKVVPFLGAAASYAGAPDGTKQLPSAAGFASWLADEVAYPGDSEDSLGKVAQYAEDWAAGRVTLLDYVSSTFDRVFDDSASEIPKPYRCGLTDFIEATASWLPRLIVTTNYDTVVERTLEQEQFRKLGVRYVAMSHIMPGNQEFGKLLCYDSLGAEPEKIVPSELDDRLKDGGPYADRVWIYKMHGTSRFTGTPETDDTIVVTETDYVRFMADDLWTRVPPAVLDALKSAHLLFLGYSLEDWNFRVLLQRLRKLELQSQLRPHWACRLIEETKAGEVEKLFWQKRNVNLYNLDLGIFFKILTGSITS